MGKSTGTRLHHSVRTAVTTAVFLGILVLSASVYAQTGSVRHTYGEGVSLISVPFDYSTDDTTVGGNPCRVFGLASDSPQKSEFNFLTWMVGAFYQYPDLPADRLVLAKGYFLYSPDEPRSVYAVDSVLELESSRTEPFVIDLQTGWNIIGSPYHGTDAVYSVRWYGDALSVLVGDTEYNIRDAIAARIIKAGLWSYIGQRYELSYTFEEWKGYWVKALQNCRLLVRRTESRSRASGAGELSLADVWSQKIVARAGAAGDEVVLGVSSKATDGCDILSDIEKPPAVNAGRYVYLSFPHSDWGVNAGSYGVDVRSVSGRKVWGFTVASNAGDADIVLTWPGLSDLPKDVNLTLVDEETGAKRFMRTSSGYQFRLGTGKQSRRFKVETVPAGQGVLRITGLTTSGGRSGSRTISCNLSSSANVDVVLKSSAGSRVIRKVAVGATRGAGLNSFVWDCRGEDGAPAPAGLYLCEVRATGDDGQVVKAVTVLTVAR